MTRSFRLPRRSPASSGTSSQQGRVLMVNVEVGSVNRCRILPNRRPRHRLRRHRLLRHRLLRHRLRWHRLLWWHRGGGRLLHLRLVRHRALRHGLLRYRARRHLCRLLLNGRLLWGMICLLVCTCRTNSNVPPAILPLNRPSSPRD